MKPYQYILLFITGTILGIVAVMLVIQYINPEEAGILGLITFYSSIVIVSASSIALISSYARMIWSQKQLAVQQVKAAFRNGILVAIAVVGTFLLQQFRWLELWDFLFMIAIIATIEIYMILKTKQKERKKEKETA